VTGKGSGTVAGRTIYLDHAATTAVKAEVLEAMLPYFTERYGNPSALYRLGTMNSGAIRGARSALAGLLGSASPDGIHFTAGGSESDNWALKAAVEARAARGNHVITTKIEHHAVLHTCAHLERRGIEVTYLEVDEYGRISPAELEKAIRPSTVLISVMFANNEIGTLEPIGEIGRIARERGILFHTDAVQAFGHLPIDVEAMSIDLLSASAHKLHGPKGIGFLYIRPGVRFGSLIHGGKQERGRRAGTENLPGIVGFGKAAELAAASPEGRVSRVRKLREHLVDRVLGEIPLSCLNGHPGERLPGNANFCFDSVEGETLLRLLDAQGICASSGSACTSGSLDPSHVLLSIGRSHAAALGSLRLSLSDENTLEDLDYTVDRLKAIVAGIRGFDCSAR